jgi:hypothetical protein
LVSQVRGKCAGSSRCAETTGVELYLVGLNGTCRRVLELAGLTELLPIRDA